MIDERRIAKIASTQHGLITLEQLSALGISRSTRTTRLASGRLVGVQRGVYRIGGSVTTYDQRALAACLGARGLVAASHRCAATLWGLDLPEAPPIELTIRTGGSAKAPGAVVHRSTDLEPTQVTRRRRIPTTFPPRILADLGAVVTAEVVGHALDDLVSRKVVTIAGVERFLSSVGGPGRRGAGVLRTVLEHRLADERGDASRLEADLARLSAQAGLPSLCFQHPIVLGGRRRRIDFALPDLRLAIEVDGYEFHSRVHVFEDDRVRGNELELAGWTVLRFTWRQVHQRPDYVIGVLRRAVEQLAA